MIEDSEIINQARRILEEPRETSSSTYSLNTLSFAVLARMVLETRSVLEHGEGLGSIVYQKLTRDMPQSPKDERKIVTFELNEREFQAAREAYMQKRDKRGLLKPEVIAELDNLFELDTSKGGEDGKS